jgi:hypothetical protein
VTAVVDLLGRKTTLMQCDETTLKWLDHRARKLVKARTAFQDEILKCVIIIIWFVWSSFSFTLLLLLLLFVFSQRGSCCVKKKK